MRYDTEWKDYGVIATGNGMKLERFGEVVLLRPDPQIIWAPPFDLYAYPGLSAVYMRNSAGGGHWEYRKKVPEEFVIGWRDLRFSLKLMGFKHTGIFPEQAYHWAKCIDLIKGAGREINVLNLFAYTGGATVACASAGAKVCHVDAAKAMCERAGRNMALSGLKDRPVRYIVDDCFKFVEREIRRGNKYDAVIMDPPSYGRGPRGELWKLEDKIYGLVSLTSEIISDKPLFYLLNSYTTGLQPTVMKNVLELVFEKISHNAEAYELGLPTEQKNIILPCGAGAMLTFDPKKH